MLTSVISVVSIDLLKSCYFLTQNRYGKRDIFSLSYSHFSKEETISESPAGSSDTTKYECKCGLCNDIGLHELKCLDEKRKTNKSLDKRLDKNSRLKNFQQQEYAKKQFKTGKPDAKGYIRDIKEHFVFGQNVSKSMPSEIADALMKRDAEKFYNLKYPGKTLS